MVILVDAENTRNGVGIRETSTRGAERIEIYLRCGCSGGDLSCHYTDEDAWITCNDHSNRSTIGRLYGHGWAVGFRTDRADRHNVMNRIEEWTADMLNTQLENVEVTWNGE